MCQQYSRIEHVIIDGGSTDGTLDEIDAFRNDIDYLISEPDGGIYAAMNKGVAASTGDFLFFLNSDDYFPDDLVLDDVARTFDSNDGLELVYGDVLWDTEGSYELHRQPRVVDRRYLAKRTLIHQTVFASSRLFDAVGGFSEEYTIVGDYEWLLRVFLNHSPRTAHIDRAVCVMSTTGASWTTHWEPERRSAMAQYYHPIEILIYRALPQFYRRARRYLNFP